MVRITSYVIGIIVLIVLVKGIGSFIQGSILNVLMALILLVVIRLLHRIIKLLLDSCRLVSRLPVGRWLGRLGGLLLVVAGVVRLLGAVCYFEVLFLECLDFDGGFLKRSLKQACLSSFFSRFFVPHVGCFSILE